MVGGKGGGGEEGWGRGRVKGVGKMEGKRVGRRGREEGGEEGWGRGRGRGV